MTLPNAMPTRTILLALSIAFSLSSAADAQPARASASKAAPASAFNAATYDSLMLSEFAWRPIGPAVTSGRVVDLAVDDGPQARASGSTAKIVYAAAASGGVWKTVNAGTTWEPIFDKQGSSSIGDIAIAANNPELVWVGTGEANNSRSSSWGDGVYKSENGGKTWQHMGLRTSQHIGRILVHPTNHDIVYVASVGPLWTSGGERGLFKTTDGGKTWKAVLTIDEHTGVTDLVMDPTNPDVLYAAAFQRQRKAYSFVGGGPGSGIYKSTDAGATWQKLTEGLPKGDIGRIGLAVSESQPRTLYATLETKTTEVYRSDDFGASWTKKGTYMQFPWYMAQIRVDPKNPERVYLLGVPLFVSEDGGLTNRTIATSAHVDYHAMWIDRDNPDHFIVGNDGGVYISHDRGNTMDFVSNLPIAQYYAIDTDNRLPFYYVYGGLQDNNSWAGPSQTRNSQGITSNDWYVTVGGDGFYSAVDPTDHNVVYAEFQNGGIIRYDVRTGEQKSIQPQAKFGEKNLRYNWSVPIVISPHDHNTVYFGAQYFFKSPNRGDSWQQMGGDLTRALDRDKLPLMGKQWGSDAVARHAGTAEFGNISTIDESPIKAGLIYVGTDDGLIQVTRDGGTTWTKIEKFPGVPEMTYVSRVVASTHSEGTVYATFDGHRSNDFKPYVLKSADYGKTWTSIAANLPMSSVQVIREHPRAPSLLFIGNEIGAWYSGSSGRTWSQLRYNLPTVPVHDIKVQKRENDLVIGTHGRGIFIIDDITPLERLAEADRAQTYLFPVKPVTLFNYNNSFPGGVSGAGSLGERSYSAPNPPFGATLTYYVKDSLPRGRTLSLAIFDSTGARVRDLTVNSKQGLHRATWDLRLGPPYFNPRAQGQRGQPQGAFVLPGRYSARLTLGGRDSIPATSMETAVIVNPDPLVTLTPAEYRALHAMRLRAADQQAKVQAVVRSAELLKDQMTEVKNALQNRAGTDSLSAQVATIEKELDDILLKVRGRQGGAQADADDRTRFAPSIQSRVNQVANQIGDVTSPPTQIQSETLDLAMSDLQKEVARLNVLLSTRVPSLNAALDAAGVPWTVGRAVR